MKSLFNFHDKRAVWGIFSIVLLTLLLAGCSGTVGGAEPETPKPEPKPTELNFRTDTVGMTYCEINWNWLDGCTFDSVVLSTKEDFSSDNKTIGSSFWYESYLPYKISNLKPGIEYYLKLSYRTRDYETVTKVINFKTNDKGPLDNLKIEYDKSSKCVKLSYDWIRDEAKIKFIKIYRKIQNDDDWNLIAEGSVKDSKVFSGFEDYEYTSNEKNIYKIELYDADWNNLGSDVTSELSVTPEDLNDILGIKVSDRGYSYLDLHWDYTLYDSYKITYKGSSNSETVEYSTADLKADESIHFDFPITTIRTSYSNSIAFTIECYKNGVVEKTVERTFEIDRVGAPENLSSELNNQYIKLQWNAFKSDNAICKIYRRIAPDAEYELIGTEKKFYSSSSDYVDFKDKSFVAGTTNYYKVELYKANDKEAGELFGYTEVSCDANSKCSITFDLGDKRDTNYDKEQFEIHYFDKGTDLATYDNGSAYDDQPYVFVANEYKDFYEFDSSTWLKNDGTKFDFNTTISENILLKAVYRPKPTSFTNYLTEDTKFYLNWKEFKGCTYKLEYGKKGGTLKSVNCGTNTSKVLENLEAGQEYEINLYTVTEDNITSKATTKELTAGPQETEFLFIMYMDGDNNLNNPIYLDMNEVEYGLSQLTLTDHVRVIALWDGFSGDTENPASSLWGTPTTHIYELGSDSRHPGNSNSMDFLGLSSNTFDWSYTADWLSSGEVDMSSKETLQNYLEWIKAHFTGTKTILQFSNHGGGPRSIFSDGKDYGRRAMCWDETTGDIDHFLKTKDVSEVLEAVDLKNGNKIDLVIEDVCLGSTIEEAYQYSPYAEYFIASPNTVPGFGLDYDILLASMEKNTKINEIGEGIVKQYKKSFALTKTDWMKILAEYKAKGANLDEKGISLVYNGACGLTFVKLEELDGVLTKLDKLAEGLCSLQGKNINMDVILNTSTVQLEGNFLELMRDYLVRPGNPIYYQGSYTWLYDIGAILDAIYKLCANNTNLCSWLGSNSSINAMAWMSIAQDVMSPLSKAIACSWRDGYTKPSYDTTVYWSNAWIGNSLYNNYYGLSICGGTITEDIDAQKYPSFYETDLQFAKDCPHWNALLKLWFPAE